MQLRNPFPDHVRLLYLYSHECWICGQNGTQTGGIELHHIYGRISGSVLNSAPLCHNCHESLFATQEIRVSLFKKTLRFLLRTSYKLLDIDNEFLEIIKNDLHGLNASDII